MNSYARVSRALLAAGAAVRDDGGHALSVRSVGDRDTVSTVRVGVVQARRDGDNQVRVFVGRAASSRCASL